MPDEIPLTPIGPVRPRRDPAWSAVTLVMAGIALLGIGRLGPATAPASPAPELMRLADVELPALEPVEAAPTFLDIEDLSAPRVRAAAGILYNPRTDEILWESHGLEPRPIASITKVMTALVLLDQEPDLSHDVVVARADVRRASTTYLRRNERITLDGLLHLALIASDNAAARALARASGLGTRHFVARMNEKAGELGLDATQFVEPSGLDERNISTPYDIARMIAHASAEPRLAHIMRKSSHRLRTSRRRLTVRNTNRLLRGRYLVQGGKTGYIDEAGYCLTAVVKLPDSDPLAVVVLGVNSNAGRFREARRLVDWVTTKGRPLIDRNARAD